MTNKKFDSIALYRIRKLLSELSDKTGRGTELVTLYLPAKKPVHEAISALREESGTASNIKSDTTRTHVQDALTKVMQRLRLYKQTPENGIVIFCGAIPGPGGPGNEIIELYEVVPNKPVSTYLYRCLAPDTRIMLQNGMYNNLSDLKSTWRNKIIKSTEEGGKRINGSKIIDFVETRAAPRKVYRLTSESGRTVTGTDDHPFFTPRGWKRLGDIQRGEFICVYPADDIETLDQNTCVRATETEEVLLDEDSIRRMVDPPANIDLAIRRLRKRGLLPLRASNPKLAILSRILGHIFSDGSMTNNIELRKGGPYSHYTIDLCLGDREAEEEIRADLISIGAQVQKSYRTEHLLNVNGRSYITSTLHIKYRDTAVCALLRALGAPIGSKFKNGTKVPPWLFQAPLAVQKEFLASYLGGDGDAPRILGSNLVSAIRLVFHRVESLKEQSSAFALDLIRLFGNFGVRVNTVTVLPGYQRKDGERTLEFELRFSLSEENVLRICHAVGYRYSKRKAASAAFVGEYLRIKAFQRKNTEKKLATAGELFATGTSLVQIAKILNIPGTTASSWAQGKISRPIVRSSTVPEFSKWLSISRVSEGKSLVWEQVDSIETVELDIVQDLTVESEDHSFFANGFLVHNCDDHFHLEPLRDMLREENVIGILAMDATEAGLGIVSGDSWEVVDATSSGVSGKTRKGGQCVSSDTLVQLEDGRLAPIKQVAAGSRIASYNFADHTEGVFECTDAFSMVPKEYLTIETIRPKMSIQATGEHRFFTVTPRGIDTICASGLREGDRILVSRKLPEPTEPSLVSRFPVRFIHKTSLHGREIIREARRKRYQSQGELARWTGLHQTEISQLETGERSLSWDKLSRVVAALFDDPEAFIATHIERTRTLPEYLSPELLQLMGYISGDGSISENRVALYEQRLEVAKFYSEIAKKSLKLESVPIRVIDKTKQAGSFAKQPYYETRIYSKDFADALGTFYPELVEKSSRSVPDQICRLDNRHLAYFIRGLFDAEGHARRSRIGIGMKSGMLIRQLQMLLLRYGIVSSYSQSTNRYGSRMHHLDISDVRSLEIFFKEIGFTAGDKMKKLEFAAKRPSTRSYLNVPVMGSSVDRMAKTAKIRREDFGGITNFFSDTRGASRGVFARVVSTFEKALTKAHAAGSSQEIIQFLEDSVSELSKIGKSELILAVVNKITLERNSDMKRFVDLELPLTQNFIGNGFVLHNSARRYERLREMELTDYYNRLADHAKKVFLEQYTVKGLIVSGPGPTKDEFVKDQYLDYRLQNLIVGTLDTGYAGREGVRETIEKSGKLLENVRVVEEKKLVQRFLRELNSDTGLAIYGINDVLAALKRAAVDTILVNDDIDTTYMKATCGRCGTVRERFVQRQNYVSEKQNLLSDPCPNCQSTEIELAEKDIVDFLADASIDSGANVEIVSSKTEDGSMLKSFGGVSALLRYKV